MALPPKLRRRPRPRVAPAAPLALALAALAGCGTRAPRPEAGAAVLAAAAALQRGNASQAEDLLARARARFPDHGLVRLWSAEVATMRWRDDDALHDLQAALAIDDGALTNAELHGKVGDLLFRIGRYGDAAGHLLAGQVGTQGAMRQALAQLAQQLPRWRPVPDLDSAELSLVEGPLPVLVCTVGAVDLPFVLDTRATFTTLTNSLAAELAVSPVLPAGKAKDGAGRELSCSLGILRALALQAVEIGPLPVLVVEDQALALRDAFGGAATTPRALVGQDVLRRFRVTFDPGRQSVVFQTPRGLEERASVPCLCVEESLLLPVQVEQRQLWMVLDTGASESSLTPLGLAELPGGERRARESLRRIYGPGGARLAVRKVQGLTLRASEVLFRGVDLHVVERAASGMFPVHGVLGADLVMRCRTTLDGGRIRMEQG